MSETSVRKRKDKSNRNGIVQDASHKETKNRKHAERKATRPQAGWASMFIFFILSIVVSILIAILLLEIKDRRDAELFSSQVERNIYTESLVDKLVEEKSFTPDAGHSKVEDGAKTKIPRIIKEKEFEPTVAQTAAVSDIDKDKRAEQDNLNTEPPKLKEPEIPEKLKDSHTASKKHTHEHEKLSESPKNEIESTNQPNPPTSNDEQDSVKVEETPLERPMKGAQDELKKASGNSSRLSAEEEDATDKKLLRDLYIEVEGLADDILSRDPKNEMLKLLAPHLEKVLKDMENGKYSGVEDALRHAKDTLEAVKERIPHDGVSGNSQPSLSQEDIEEVKEILKQNSPIPKKRDTAPPTKDKLTKEKKGKGDPSSEEKHNGKISPQSGKEGDEKQPVEEIIPEPIHITPLGDKKEPSRNEKEDAKVPPSKLADGGEKSKSQLDPFEKRLLDARKWMVKDPLKALKMYDNLMVEAPDSFEAIYGRAQALDSLAEEEKSNSRLEQAIQVYLSLVELAEKQPQIVDEGTYQKIGLTCAARMAFRGWHSKAINVLQQLTQRFPNNLAIQNKLGVTLLMVNQPSTAFEVFKKVLELHPNDGFAQVHYGFILKTTYDNNTEGVKYLARGIDSGDEGTSDGRFYFHLGDGLQRLGKKEEAYKVYDEGVEKGLFMSRYQRSLYNVERLTSRPVWTKGQTTYTQFFSKLESHWREIKEEALKILSQDMTSGFVPESENLRDTGDWQQFDLFSRGKKVKENCAKAPKTCALVEKFVPAASCKRGQVKFSVMQPGTHVWSHTGPTNCRLRAHLGLVVPPGLKMRVAEDFITWEEGKVLVFDDSFEHEVWHEGKSPRLVLIADVWHPDLTEAERRSLSPI